jgi:hypothetical protein
MADQDRDDGSGHNRRIPRVGFDPSDLELPPGNEPCPRTRELGGAATDRDRQFVDVPARGRQVENSDRLVRQRQIAGIAEKPIDGVGRRPSGEKHLE